MSWQDKKLGDVAKVISGYAFKSKDFIGSGIPVIKITNIKHEYVSFEDTSFLPENFLSIDKKYHVSENDLLISLTGSHISQPNSVVGRVARYNHKFTALLNQRAGKIMVSEKKANPKFLYYFLRQPKVMHDLALNAGGAANQANISPSNIENLIVKTPDLKTQERIASILSTYDDLIENNRRRIQLLEESARLLYREWFVHFRFPRHEYVEIVDGLPQGWEKVKLGEKIVLNYGKALKADDRIEGEHPVFGSSGTVGSHNKALAKGPGIIVGRKGNAGSTYWSYKDYYAIDTVYYITLESSNFYLFNVLKNMQFVNSDAAVPGLNRDYAYSREYLVPSKNIFKLFNDIVSPIYEQIYKLQDYNEKLKQARDILLPRLMNGEITV
jgi:type I restriction enzyme S subunit